MPRAKPATMLPIKPKLEAHHKRSLLKKVAAMPQSNPMQAPRMAEIAANGQQAIAPPSSPPKPPAKQPQAGGSNVRSQDFTTRPLHDAGFFATARESNGSLADHERRSLDRGLGGRPQIIRHSGLPRTRPVRRQNGPNDPVDRDSKQD